MCVCIRKRVINSLVIIIVSPLKTLLLNSRSLVPSKMLSLPLLMPRLLKHKRTVGSRPKLFLFKLLFLTRKVRNTLSPLTVMMVFVLVPLPKLLVSSNLPLMKLAPPLLVTPLKFLMVLPLSF